MSQELIIGLTEHRTFGYIFQAFLIEQKASFYSILSLVKQRDIVTLRLNKEQATLIELIEKYSDENLVKKFSKKKESGVFFQKMDPDLFKNHISPYIDKHMIRIIHVLMSGDTRLFFKQTKYSNLYDEDLITLPKTFTECTFNFNRNEDGTKYSLQMVHENQPLNLLHKSIKMVSSEPCSLVWQNTLYVFEKINAKRLLPFFEKEFVFIPSAVEDKYYKSFVLNTIKEHHVKATGFTISSKESPKQGILSLEPNLSMEAILLPKFSYGEKEYLANNKTEVIVTLEKNEGSYQFTKISRNWEWEDKQMQRLSDLDLQQENGGYFPKGAELLSSKDRLYKLVNWLNQNAEKLNTLGFQLCQNQYEHHYSTEKQNLDIQIKADDDWFDIYAKVTFGEYQIPFIKLKKNILNGIREFELPDGTIAILPKEWFSEYQEFLPYTTHEGNKLRLKKFHGQLIPKRLRGIDKSFFNRLQDIGQKSDEKVVLPSQINASLRSYQHEGYSWMFRLFENQFGGCLADDMGLGKTLQTLTLLLKLKRLKRDIPIPNFNSHPSQTNLSFTGEGSSTDNHQAAALIVMPTSLIHNWENEIKKFTPSLKVYKHFGVQRNKTATFNRLVQYYDIIITTYGMIRNDFELLRQHEFFYLILDESQNIKNPGSKTYQAVTRLKAKNRLVLTGTPIENSLSDLWAQINFINKGLLGNLAFFKREFITPIEKKNDVDKQEKLQTLIRPFILRRTKDQVATDLPALTEQVRYCQLVGEQKRIYETEKSAIRNNILENIEKEGVKKSAIVMLQGLTKLRQLANHPSMLNGKEENESGKFDEIFRSLDSLISEKHKVLIFSSFVKHLELVKERVESKKWKYSLLTGQTSNRAQVIKNFQEDPENRIFLISLKAGGVGLNLTSADYVFIIDPWWNPASELQAISRAHRIGQNKKVMVYRFITEESIEEKIQQLQERKSSLSEKFINSNNPFQAITKEEILDLFS